MLVYITVYNCLFVLFHLYAFIEYHQINSLPINVSILKSVSLHIVLCMFLRIYVIV